MKHKALPQIELLALDVDGVLTDGSILIDDLGHETKRFNVRDGFAMKLWQRMGFGLAVITGRSGDVVKHRMAELGVGHVYQGASDKAAVLERLSAESGVGPERIAYMGDDWPDLPVLRRVGYPMAVADASPEVLRVAAFVSTRPGGRGAVREAVEHLLAGKGLMEQALGLYDSPL